MPAETRRTFSTDECQGVGGTPRAALEDFMTQTRNMKNISIFKFDLTGMDFRGCIFSNALFTECNLSNCNFQGCDLTEVFFATCTLDYADFRGAKLRARQLMDTKLYWKTAIFGPPIDGNQLLLEF